MIKTKACARPLSRPEGFAHIENYYRSGLRPTEYYKQHGITEWQFYFWRKRYLSLHPEAENSGSAEKKFHPVKIESVRGTRLSGLEIHYPNGVRVVIGNDHSVEIENLTELIKLRV